MHIFSKSYFIVILNRQKIGLYNSLIYNKLQTIYNNYNL